MIFLRIIAFAVIGVFFLVLLKRNAPSFAILCEVTVVAITVLSLIPEIEKLLSLLNNFQGVSSVSEISLKTMFKTFGFLAVGAVVSDVCRDNGESAVASVVELSVRILAISCALPVFRAVVEIALTFFSL